MNVTNTEIIQATIDMFFCLFCAIMAITIRVNKPTDKSIKIFIKFFVAASLLFFGEAFAYVSRGNTNRFFVIETRLSNFVVYLMNIIMSYLYIKYIYSLISDDEETIKHKRINVAYVISCVNLLILLINIFSKWMYSFDDKNYYHRNYMWYIYTVLSLGVIVSGMSLAVKYRKKIEIRRFVSTLMFSVIPIVATIIQAFMYGFSITNFALGIGLVVMFISYIYEWARDKSEQLEQLTRKRIDSIVLFMIMLFSMSASIFSAGVVIQSVSTENSEMQSKTVAQFVTAQIENEFIRPITVSHTLSQDFEVRNCLRSNSESEAEDHEQFMKEHLDLIRDGFGYQMVFAVSDESKAYYTYNGICGYIDVENNAHDIWYKEILDSDKTYVVNVDTDVENDWDLSFFVNYKVLDENENLLGVCGVGVSVVDVAALIAKYEMEYDIRINFVNRDGLIMFDSDSSLIENESLDNSYFDEMGFDEFYYKRSGDVCYITKYINALDWYMVITDYEPVKIDVNEILIPIVLIFVGGILIMAFCFGMSGLREKKVADAYQRRYEASIKDELTNLYNRRAYENDCERILKDNKLSKYSIIMMDLNGLKFANDKIGHEAGDELIIGSARCMENAFSSVGKAYRVGGDEFVVLLNCSKEKVDDAVKTFDYLTSTFKGKFISDLTVSKGVVVCAEHPDLSFEEMKALADKLMYADKDAYYERTGKKRREV